MGGYEDHMFLTKRWLAVYTLFILPLVMWASSPDIFAMLRVTFFYLTGAFIFLGGGMLPDVDSPLSAPSQLARQVSNTLFVVLFSAITAGIGHFGFGMGSVELIPYIFAAVVLAVAFNWIFSYYLIKELTDHRGHTHSLIAAIVFGLVVGGVFYLSWQVAGTEWWLSLMMGSMAFFGYLSHLTCDEIFSSFADESDTEKQEKFQQWWFSWRYIWFDDDGKKKKSAGTAFKWW